MSRRHACGAALALGILAIAPRAAAQDVVPIYIAEAPGCSTPAELVAGLDEATRGRVRLESAERAPMRVSFERGQDAWQVIVDRGPLDQATRRSLEVHGADCHALDGPTRFVLAMLIEGWAEHAAQPSPAAPPTPPRVEASPRPATPAGHAWELGLGVSAQGSLPTVGVHLEVGVRPAALAQLALRWSVEAPTTVGALASPGRADVLASTVSARWCPELLRQGTLALGLCAGPVIGLVRARGLDFAHDLTAYSISFGLFAGARIEVDLATRWFVAGGTDLGVAIVQPKFFASDAAGRPNDLLEPSTVELSAYVTAGLRFGS